MQYFQNPSPNQDGFVVRVSVSQAVALLWVFAPQPGHTKDHHKNATRCLHAWHSDIRVGVQPYCLKGWVVRRTVYGDMHYNELINHKSGRTAASGKH